MYRQYGDGTWYDDQSGAWRNDPYEAGPIVTGPAYMPCAFARYQVINPLIPHQTAGAAQIPPALPGASADQE